MDREPFVISRSAVRVRVGAPFNTSNTLFLNGFMVERHYPVPDCSHSFIERPV